MTDRERALELLTRIVTANDGADPGCTARECLVALEGLGYRPTEARPSPAWDRQHAGGTPPDAATPGAAAYREARLELEHRLIETGALDDEDIYAHTLRGSEHNRIQREADCDDTGSAA